MVQYMNTPFTPVAVYQHYYIIHNALKVKEYVSYHEACNAQEQVYRLKDGMHGENLFELNVDIFVCYPRL